RLVAAPVGQGDLDIIFEPELVDRPRRQVQPGLEPPRRPTKVVVVARTADEREDGTLRVRIALLFSIRNVGHALPLSWISPLTGGSDRWRRRPAGRAPESALVVQEVDQPQRPVPRRFPRTRSRTDGAQGAPRLALRGRAAARAASRNSSTMLPGRNSRGRCAPPRTPPPPPECRLRPARSLR